MDLNTRIHWTGQFLPWHRWYVHVFEESLKCKCGYTGVSPYWNWTIDSPDFFESSFWKDSDPMSGLGGWGDPNADFSAMDHPLVPNLDFQKEANVSFSASAIETLLETPAGDFKGFQAAFEVFQGAHSAVHLITGGDLATLCPKNAPQDCWKIPVGGWAPNEPLFFMHHAMIDKVWSDWQHRNPENAKSFFGGSVQAIQSLDSYNKYPNGAPPFLSLDTIMPSDGLFPEVTIGDVLNTTGGVLCYVYE
ncbi:hypothetical protein BC826DRAFT_1102698 [Russula brevipes]|nr:hypothetical protein BC826DRAFT_1102698 [Russula brevipes]